MVRMPVAGQMKYGTREWFELQYDMSPDDPWGLDWRPSQRFRYKTMLAALQRAARPDWVPAHIIDVGCATGAFTAHLSTLWRCDAVSVIGVDIAESAVARARAHYPAITFKRMSLNECSRQFAASADLVTCLEVLYYLPDEQRVAALQMLRGMLQPGGMLLVSSMIARRPYMSLAELRALVENELFVVDVGVLYLKPIVLIEKALMRLRSAWLWCRDSGASIRDALPTARRMERLAALSESLLGARAQSHGYVLARLNDDGRAG